MASSRCTARGSVIATALERLLARCPLHRAGNGRRAAHATATRGGDVGLLASGPGIGDARSVTGPRRHRAGPRRRVLAAVPGSADARSPSRSYLKGPFTTATVNRFTGDLARAGVGVYEPGATRPVRRVRGRPSPLRVSATQLRSLAAGAWARTGLSGKSLNAVSGSVRLSRRLKMSAAVLVAGWAKRAHTPKARLARRIMGRVDGGATAARVPQRRPRPAGGGHRIAPPGCRPRARASRGARRGCGGSAARAVPGRARRPVHGDAELRPGHREQVLRRARRGAQREDAQAPARQQLVQRRGLGRRGAAGVQARPGRPGGRSEGRPGRDRAPDQGRDHGDLRHQLRRRRRGHRRERAHAVDGEGHRRARPGHAGHQAAGGGPLRPAGHRARRRVSSGRTG